MATRSKLAVILHADVVGSTALVRRDEQLAHDRIRTAFHGFSLALQEYGGIVHEVRGDALVAEFSRASDSVLGALCAQQRNTESNAELTDAISPEVRVGIALGEVVIADGTLTGAGVILAQRLEQLSAPGGVAISAAVREAVPDRLPFDYSDLGAQDAKGFDQPVVVCAVTLKPGAALPVPTSDPSDSEVDKPRRRRLAAIGVVLVLAMGGTLAWLQPWKPDMEPADPSRLAYALPDRPSVAVMPFQSMPTHREQGFFAAGMTEDIVTDLSKLSGLFVFARNSTARYKGSMVEARQVAEELGVRYVLEGSVRRSAEKIRITVQLIDALKGDNLWAERYDREWKDIFGVQAEVAQRVARALHVTVSSDEHERLFRKYTPNIEVYDAFIQARRSNVVPSRANVERAERLFERVIELDPNFAGGYAGLSFNYSMKARFQHGTSPGADAKQSLELATKAVAIDPKFGWVHIALGGAHLANGDPDAAVEAVRQALVIQPNDYDANLFMGFYLHFAGNLGPAIKHLELARRMSPVDTARNSAFLGMAYFMEGNYDGSLASWKERLNKGPPNPTLYTFLAATYSMLERREEAASIAARLLKIAPNFSLSGWQYIHTYKSEEHRTRLYNAARKAGIPQRPRLTLPARPSIAVLPFKNLSGDTEQEYFSDAITEDIVTDLAKVSGIFVVASNSSFSYKGASVTLRQVAEELGVRYVLQGSVRRSDDQLRITAQLIDAVKGNHLWGERYDRPLTGLFSVQTEVANKVTKALAVTLTANEVERLYQKHTSSINAYDVYLKARRTTNSPSLANVELGEKLYRRVIELDPDFAGGYAGLSYVYNVRARFRYGPDPKAYRVKALELAKKGVELDRSFAWAHIALGGAYLANRDPVAAVDAARAALALEPNGYDANLYMGFYLQFAGEPTLAVEHAEIAKRLSPVDTVRDLAFLGRAYFMNGNYRKAVDAWATRYRKFPVSSPNGFVYLAAAYSLLEMPAQAAATVDKLREAFPRFHLSKWSYINLYKSEEDRTRLYEAAKKAGVPEHPQSGK